MKPKYTIEFQPVEQPISEPVTKFGGQPVWIDGPAWPLSHQLKRPMRFICQIALPPEIFGDVAGKMTYIFMTDDDEHVEGTWEPDSGENAVIIQPNGDNPPTSPLETGPTLYTKSQNGASPQPCECAVNLIPDNDFSSEPADDYDYNDSKIGGLPMFLQGDEYPDDGEWNLLLQLDSVSPPFQLNFGDAGVAYVYLSPDGKTGRFLWQCC